MNLQDFRPKSIYFQKVQSLLDWTPESQPFDAFNIALVPLRPRPDQLNESHLMDCHDFKGGYVENADLWPQGSDDANTYNFSYWQYVDSFCYFSHNRITIPTTWWINCAHQNGVPIIGTLIWEDFSGDNQEAQKDVELMFNPEKGKPYQALQKLIAIAEYYGFDGWFFNIEVRYLSACNVTPEHIISFIKQLRQGLKQNNSSALVVCYDGLSETSGLHFQNCLNKVNNSYFHVGDFHVSDGFFANYNWDEQGRLIQTSVQTAQGDNRSPYEVYTGVDVWGRGTFYQPGFDSCRAVGIAVSGGTSVGLFAPGWTFERAEGSGEEHHQNFEARDRKFWIGEGAGHNAGNSQKCIAQYIPARPVPAALPFYTNFDRGRGFRFTVRGQEVSSQQWSNLSLQGLQPTYRFWAVEGNDQVFVIDFTQDSSYDGGASLKIEGNSASTQDSVTYRLFDFSTKIEKAFQVNAVFQPLSSGTAFPRIRVKLVFDDSTSFVTSSTPQQKDGWYYLSDIVDASYAGKTLTQLCLVIGPSFDGNPPTGNYGVLIGMLSIWDRIEPEVPSSVQGLQGSVLKDDTNSNHTGLNLTWQYPKGAGRFYDIWQIGNSGEKRWLIRVCANAAWIENIVPMSGSDSVTVGVQPVSYGFVEQPLEQMATIAINLNA